jgi:hypothetical protein
MAVPELSETFKLSDEAINNIVTKTSPGVYALDKTSSGPFKPSYVGRSDSDINARLHRWANDGRYKFFQGRYCDSAEEAFEAECQLYHALAPEDNINHPARPNGSNWSCPVCYLFG